LRKEKNPGKTMIEKKQMSQATKEKPDRVFRKGSDGRFNKAK